LPLFYINYKLILNIHLHQTFFAPDRVPVAVRMSHETDMNTMLRITAVPKQNLVEHRLRHVSIVNFSTDNNSLTGSREWLSMENKKLNWCWKTRATRLEVIQGNQTWYHSIR